MGMTMKMEMVALQYVRSRFDLPPRVDTLYFPTLPYPRGPHLLLLAIDIKGCVLVLSAPVARCRFLTLAVLSIRAPPTAVSLSLSLCLVRDGKFPKSLSAALDPAAAGDVPAAASSVFVGAAARAAAAAAQVTSKLGAGKAASSKKGLMGSPSGKGKGPGSVSRPNHRPRRTGGGDGGEEEEEEDGAEEDGEEASIMALLPPR